MCVTPDSMHGTAPLCNLYVHALHTLQDLKCFMVHITVNCPEVSWNA